MSAEPVRADADDRGSYSETVAGLLAAASIAFGALALAYRPAVIAPAAVVIALIAAAMGGRHAGLARTAVFLGAVWWVVGMTFAIWFGTDLY